MVFCKYLYRNASDAEIMIDFVSHISVVLYFGIVFVYGFKVDCSAEKPEKECFRMYKVFREHRFL